MRRALVISVPDQILSPRSDIKQNPNFESLETDLDSRAAKTGYESRMNVFWPCELLLATKYCYYTTKKTLEAACGRLHNGRNRYAAAGRVTAIGGSN